VTRGRDPERIHKQRIVYSLNLKKYLRTLIVKQDALLSQGGPRDTAVNVDMYRILQRYHAVSLATTLISCWSLSANCSELSVKK